VKTLSNMECGAVGPNSTFVRIGLVPAIVSEQRETGDRAKRVWKGDGGRFAIIQ
jgi:hypothetical protein